MRSHRPSSAVTGLYIRPVPMSFHELPSRDRCHFRVLPALFTPSSSVSIAVNSTPTRATAGLSVTSPGSSAFVTRIVTDVVSASSPSLAATLTM